MTACTLGIVGLSIWSTLAPDGLRHVGPSGTEIVAQTADGGSAASAPGENPPFPHASSSGQSGANVERHLNDDGSVVTKFTPKGRDQDGPAFIAVGQQRGQDPRMAAFPNEALLEDSPEGRLPIIGPDGLRPVDHYARPWSGARGTRIALVVAGLGLSQTGTQKAIAQLPPDVTLAFAASGNSLQRWMQEARRNGHEIVLQVPFEPYDYPDNDPGPNTLRVDVDAAGNLAALHRSLARITNYTGIMNYLGGRFLSNADALEPVMRDLARRGLLFLDDGTSAQSLSGTLARTFEMPHGFADLVLDGTVDEQAILRKLDELERIARRNGSAIGVASAFDESIAAIAKWTEEASARGIEFVSVSALMTETKTP